MTNKLPQQVFEGLLACLQETHGTSLEIENFETAHGGCINDGGALTTTAGTYFVKWNQARKFPDMFKAERRGLTLLRQADAIRVPEVLAVGETGNSQFIIMEFIQGASGIRSAGEQLGKGLARLHRTGAERFGLDHSNYMGSLRQFNNVKDSWVEFFITERLEPQVKVATDTHNMPVTTAKRFDVLYTKLPVLLVEENPTLVHGDLWSGNVLADANGEPWLIDPAVYYGNREVDLAMTTLFGGFDEPFYSSYQDAFPLEPGAQERFDLYNLYPLLVHVNLFGQGYLNQVSAILNTFL